MHRFVLLFALHFSGKPASDPWFGADKAKHFLTSVFVESGSFSVLRRTGLNRDRALAGSVVFSSAVGAGKELYDKKFGGDPSLKDLAWDGAGIAAAAAMLRHTQP